MNRRPLPPALLWPLAIAVGVGLFFLTNLIEQPNKHGLFNFGVEYGQMAADPFGLVGKYPHRIFSPLLANVLGLGGADFKYFAYGAMVGLMAMWFAAANLLGANPLQALVLTTTLSFTGAVQIFKGHLGYPDPMTFLLMTAAIVAHRRPMLFWTLTFANVMHHEQIVFFVPWLIYWRHRPGHEARWQHDVVGVLAMVALYAAWRVYVKANSQAQFLTLEHYVQNFQELFPEGPIGLSALNLASTFIWFGLLPIVIAWHGFVDGWRKAGFGILLLLACLHAVFGVAHDVYRFTCFLFVPVMFAGLRLMQERWGTLLFAAFGGATVFLIEKQKWVFAEVGNAVLVKLTPDGPIVRPHIVKDIVPEVIPAFWLTFTLYGVALIATTALGWVWARSTRPRTTPETGA